MIEQTRTEKTKLGLLSLSPTERMDAVEAVFKLEDSETISPSEAEAILDYGEARRGQATPQREG